MPSAKELDVGIYFLGYIITATCRRMCRKTELRTFASLIGGEPHSQSFHSHSFGRRLFERNRAKNTEKQS